MLIKGDIVNKLSRFLLIVILVSAIWPTPAQASSTENHQFVSATHLPVSMSFAQEVEEDELVEHEVNLLPLFSLLQPSASEVFYPPYFVNQSEPLFFRYLFGTIATQAP